MQLAFLLVYDHVFIFLKQYLVFLLFFFQLLHLSLQVQVQLGNYLLILLLDFGDFIVCPLEALVLDGQSVLRLNLSKPPLNHPPEQVSLQEGCAVLLLLAQVVLVLPVVLQYAEHSLPHVVVMLLLDDHVALYLLLLRILLFEDAVGIEQILNLDHAFIVHLFLSFLVGSYLFIVISIKQLARIFERQQRFLRKLIE